MMTTASRPKILFCLASESWNIWLPYFLRSEAYVAEELYTGFEESRQRLLDCTFLREFSGIVFLSHHETLARDAELVRSIEARMPEISIVSANQTCIDLGLDKRKLPEFFSSATSFATIPEICKQEAVELFDKHQDLVLIIKPKCGTEGEGQVLVTDVRELLNFEYHEDSHIIQPCIFGTEYSINIVGNGKQCSVYEPVCKGSISHQYIHPCKRYREFPASDSRLSELLHQAAQDIISLLRPEGVLELEFIVTQEGAIYLVEINPRLSATMRMASRASEQEIFSTLGCIALGKGIMDGRIPTNAFSVEAPISSEQLELLRGMTTQDECIDLSSRITVTCPNIGDAKSKLLALLTDESRCLTA